MPFNYDLMVIGAGSGGLAAAERAASYGAKVAIAEHFHPGGACVNYGCIPEKLLDYASGFNRLEQISQSYGWQPCDRHFDWFHFVSAKEQHIRHLNQVHLHHLKDAGVQFFAGHASFVDAHTVRVAEQTITADKMLIAVGAKPAKPNIPGVEYSITWHELYHLPQQPQTVIVVGADPIGVKISGSLNALGSQVTQIITEERILHQLDAEIAQAIQDQMAKRGVQFLTRTVIQKIEKGDRLSVYLSEQAEPLVADTVLMDAHRIPNLENLNLSSAGVQVTAAGAIWVDQFSHTSQPHIFAAGDCTERIPLTPSAIAQGRAFADTEFGGDAKTTSFSFIPISISSHPEAATVGLSESQARQQFGDAIHCYQTQFRPLLYCLSGKDEKTFIKVVVNRQDADRVLGIHMIGDSAVEIIQSLAVALRLGATKRDLDCSIGIHPSSAEEIFSL